MGHRQKEARRLKAKADIEYEIGYKMSKSLECAFVKTPAVYWNVPDENGCNWHVDLFEGNPYDVSICRNTVLSEISVLQSKFNIFDPD